MSKPFIVKEHCRDVRYADEKTRKAGHCRNKTQGAEEHRRTQGWRRSRQVAMPGKASGDALLPSAGGEADFVEVMLLRGSLSSQPSTVHRPPKIRCALRRGPAERCEEPSLVLRPDHGPVLGRVRSIGRALSSQRSFAHVRREKSQSLSQG